MKQDHSHSVDNLRRESERTRAALVSTVGELRDKVTETAAELRARASPAHIKEEVKSFVREEREGLTRSVQTHIRDNPLQATAVAALLAWPAMGLVRAIPVPLLLIGAGLWLSGGQGRRASAKMQLKAKELASEGASRAEELAGTVRGQATHLRRRAEDGLQHIGDAVTTKAADMADRARAGAKALADDVGASTRAGGDARSGAGRAGETVEQVGAAAETVRRSAASAVSTAAEAVAGTAERARELAQDRIHMARERLERAPAHIGSALRDVAEQHPLLLAGIGLAAGAFIASALPTSAAERRLVGRARDEIEGRLRGAASDGLQRTAEVLDEAVKTAEREGLDAKGLAQPVADLAGEVRGIAERAIDTALGNQESGDNAKRSEGDETPTPLPAPDMPSAEPWHQPNAPQAAPGMPGHQARGTPDDPAPTVEPDRPQPAGQASAPQPGEQAGSDSSSQQPNKRGSGP